LDLECIPPDDVPLRALSYLQASFQQFIGPESCAGRSPGRPLNFKSWIDSGGFADYNLR
jgi:hypothetical protein